MESNWLQIHLKWILVPLIYVQLLRHYWTDYNLYHSNANSKLSCLLLPKSCFLLKNRREIQTKHFPLSCSFYLYEGLLYRNAQLEILCVVEQFSYWSDKQPIFDFRFILNAVIPSIRDWSCYTLLLRTQTKSKTWINLTLDPNVWLRGFKAILILLQLASFL